MTVRFHCSYCQQLLAIASRKVGCEIACPRCGLKQVVPQEDEPAALAARGTAPGESAAGPHSSDEALVIDPAPSAGVPVPPLPAEVKAAFASPPPPTSPPPASPPPVAPPPPPAATPALIAPGPRLPSDLILFPRRALYVQAGLYLVLGAAAFGAGYFIGRGNATLERRVAQETQVRQRMFVQGKLVYNPGTGHIAPDDDAVVIVLPANHFPGHPLGIQGIRPQEPPPSEMHETLRAIQQLGGAYTRSESSGDFSLTLPDRGKYHVLVISHHVRRPQGKPVDELDQTEIGKYFELPETLVGSHKYEWRTADINLGFNPIEIDFQQDEKK